MTLWVGMISSMINTPRLSSNAFLLVFLQSQSLFHFFCMLLYYTILWQYSHPLIFPSVVLYCYKSCTRVITAMIVSGHQRFLDYHIGLLIMLSAQLLLPHYQSWIAECGASLLCRFSESDVFPPPCCLLSLSTSGYLSVGSISLLLIDQAEKYMWAEANYILIQYRELVPFEHYAINQSIALSIQELRRRSTSGTAGVQLNVHLMDYKEMRSITILKKFTRSIRLNVR